ncbi:DUF806 family protein [Weissella paramesenteroides]|uniref:DUF806 family protein n=1 Tax=Weissella paramesenteroides TaxID=1249 RepID=UPI00140B5094|nr:DUF806 family protein [Weissella paramesenteroides]
MRPINLVLQIISNSFPKFHVFVDSIDEEQINNTKVTQVLLKESEFDNVQHGDDTFNSLSVGIDIQIFYSDDFKDDLTITEIKLMKDLESKGWKITDSQPHYLDISQTDIQQTIKNITVNKIITLEEVGYTG